MRENSRIKTTRDCGAGVSVVNLFPWYDLIGRYFGQPCTWKKGSETYTAYVTEKYTENGISVRVVYGLEKRATIAKDAYISWSRQTVPDNIVKEKLFEEGGAYIVDQEKFDNEYNFSKLNSNTFQSEEALNAAKDQCGSYQYDESGLRSRFDAILTIRGQYHRSVYVWRKGNTYYTADIGDRVLKDGVYCRSVFNFYSGTLTNPNAIQLKSPAGELRTYIAGWYKTLRNLALVALLSILVYIGIRILLSSVASDKAKYKQMLVDWVVAMALLLIMHYIMSFSVFIVDKIVDMIDSIQVDTAKKDEVISTLQANGQEVPEKFGTAVDIFILEGTGGNDDNVSKIVKTAWKTMVKNDDAPLKHFFYKDPSLTEKATSEDDAKVLVWPAQNFMEEARIRYQLSRDDGSQNIAMYGYGLIYVVLVIYTIIFLFTYTKRIIYMAFLTVIAPLVAVTYPIDKMNDGKAQAFNSWFREYIFNLLIQPLHLILYSLLIGSAMNFASDNLVYVVIALGFFVPAEKMLRRFFGFEKAQTPGLFGGPAGAALMFNGLSRLMGHRPHAGGLGPGKNNGQKNEEDEEGKPPRTQKIDETEGFLDDGENNEEQTDWGIGPNSIRLAQNNRRDNLEGNENNDQTRLQDQNQWNTANDTYTLDLSGDNQLIGQNAGQRNNNNNNNRYAQNPQNRRTLAQGNNRRTQQEASLPRRKRIKRSFGRAARAYGKGVRNRYVARREQKGSLLSRGIRLAGGVATATAFTAAAGIGAIVSGEPSKQIGNIITAGVGGYKLGTGVSNKAVSKVVDNTKEQKEIIKEAVEEGKKGYHGSQYAERKQEKYLKDFQKNEENIKALEDKLDVDRETAQRIMEDHAPEYVDNGITDMDEFAAVYNLEHKENMGRKKAIATRHYAMERLDGQKVKNIDPEKKAKYDDMFKQEFINAGKSERQANNTVNELYTAVDKFHKYKK